MWGHSPADPALTSILGAEKLKRKRVTLACATAVPRPKHLTWGEAV